MTRAIGLAVLALLAVVYYYFFGPVPTPSELGHLPWWRPRGWALRWETFAALKQMRDAGGAMRLVPLAVFGFPIAALAGGLLVLFRSAAARVLIATLALCCISFVYYGYLADTIWRFFDWRAPAATACFFLLLCAILFAPSLLRDAARLGSVGRALALGGGILAIYLLSTEITGTDPSLALNLSPWPVLTLFGLLLLGCAIAAWHLSAGLGVWLWARLTPARGAWLGALAAAVIGGLATRLVFDAPRPGGMLVFGLIAGGYALLAARSPNPSGSGARRALAGAALLAAILLSNRAATSSQMEARDVLAQQLIEALDRYRDARGSYPNSLDDLVPEQLAEVPRPRMGLIPDENERFIYSNFGDSFALEFASVLWVQCAYSPPYFEAYADEGEDDEELAGLDAAVDVAAGDEPTLGESWSCESRPPDLW